MLREGSVVLEGAQGVLLDEHRGFHPHTTWSTCTLEPALALLAKHQWRGAIERHGVLRTYLTRHGDGPFPTEDPAMAPLLPEPHNPSHGWQGGFRVGALESGARPVRARGVRRARRARAHAPRIDCRRSPAGEPRGPIARPEAEACSSATRTVTRSRSAPGISRIKSDSRTRSRSPSPSMPTSPASPKRSPASSNPSSTRRSRSPRTAPPRGTSASARARSPRRRRASCRFARA